MSTLKVNNIIDVAGITTVSIGSGSLSTNDIKVTTINSGPIGADKNKIINGAMEIDQRNSGISTSISGVNSYLVDRWRAVINTSSSASFQRVVDAPPGFRYSLKYTTTSAKTPVSTDNANIQQIIEGQNITDFAFGTSSAKSITLSFWVKSSVSGTFSGALRSYDGTTLRSYTFTYIINSPNTWQYITVTALGDSILIPASDITQGFAVIFNIGAGSNFQTSVLNTWQTGNFFGTPSSVSLISILNATFQITGVQLEIGTTASQFQRRSYGLELMLCQRYYQTLPTITYSTFINIAAAINTYLFPVTMRTTPTINGSLTANPGSPSIDNISNSGFNLNSSTNQFTNVNVTLTNGTASAEI
jgi:hypothetical protein